jgi:phage terminase small subunit
MKMKKLTKAEIEQGMKSVPIETIILGSQSKQGIKLTKKQKEFAEQVVATGNKTEAYRRSYNHTGKRTTAARDAQKTSNNPAVATYIQALELAKQSEEYLLPQRLRAMAIHKLSTMALDDTMPPAQQLKALELVGKMTEVALFSERREIVHSLDSSSLKAKLMEAVQMAIANSKSIRTVTKRTAQQLLAEIDEPTDVPYTMDDVAAGVMDDDATQTGGSEAVEDSVASCAAERFSEPPREATTHFLPTPLASHLHSIPHNEFQQNSTKNFPKNLTVSTQVVDIKEELSP